MKIDRVKNHTVGELWEIKGRHWQDILDKGGRWAVRAKNVIMVFPTLNDAKRYRARIRNGTIQD